MKEINLKSFSIWCVPIIFSERSFVLQTYRRIFLNANLMTDPNPKYDIFARIALSACKKHFPNKRVKVNKHKHKLSPWITTGLIKSIEFHDKLYKRLKSCPQDSAEHNRMEYNLKIIIGI